MLDVELSPEQLEKARKAGQASSAAVFREKADAGDAYAEYYLAARYAEGVGVAKDLVEARKWYFIAERRNVYTKSIVDAVESQMTPEQIAEAKRLADGFKPIPPKQSSIKRTDK